MYRATNPGRRAIAASQFWNGAFAGRLAFAACSPAPSSYSGDRTWFFGRSGSRENPAALSGTALNNRVGLGLDPAAAFQLALAIPPGQTREVYLLLGQTNSIEDVRALVARYSEGANVEAALESTRKWWDSKLGVIQVKTPATFHGFPGEPLGSCINLYRAGFGRVCGDFISRAEHSGFRDQLQDAMAFVYSVSDSRTRYNILLPRRGSLRRAMYSIGGTPRPAMAFEPAVRMIWRGFPT